MRPFYAFYSGYVRTGSLNNAGVNGNYWSSVVYSNSHAYRLAFTSARVYPSYIDWRRYGLSIRCLAR